MPPPGLPRPARPRWPRCCSTRRTRCCTSPTRRRTCAAAARSTPTASAPAGTRRRRQAQRRMRRCRFPVPHRAANPHRPRILRRPRAHRVDRRATAATARSGRTPRSPRSPRSPPAPAVLAAVRSATAGMPVTAPAAAPFAEGRWLFSHNGLVRGWPDAVAALAAELPVTDLLTLDAPTDSALLWALVRHRLRAGDDPAAVLAGVVRAVAAAAPGSRLNLLLTDGTAIWATTWTHALSVRIGGGRGHSSRPNRSTTAADGWPCRTGTWWSPPRSGATSTRWTSTRRLPPSPIRPSPILPPGSRPPDPVAAGACPPGARSAGPVGRFPRRHGVAVKESHDHPHRPARRPPHPGRRARRPARRRAARADRRGPSSCRRSGSTTRAAASCSSRSPSCPSTTRPAPRRRCSPPTSTTSPA